MKDGSAVSSRARGGAVAGTEFLAGGGEMGRLMRAKDWAKTPVGSPDRWPQSLKTTVQIMLGSRYAMWLGWGPELTFFYNDAYRPTLGTKHPWALGASAREVWAEIWPAIGPRIAHVLESGEATWDEGLQLFLERHGYPEETYHTFSYSPAPDDGGGTGGLLCVVTEETDRVIGERRLRVLREVAAGIAGTHTPEEVFAATENCLRAHGHDAPFALLYLFDTEIRQAKLVAASDMSGAAEAAPAAVALTGDAGPWPLAEAARLGDACFVDDIQSRFASLPTGPWARPPRRAVVLPIAQQGQARAAGALVVGLNPHRPFDVEYRGFLDLLVGQLAAGLANARAYEEERRRAEALAEIDRAKTTFFSNASHEFRTPLTLMLSPLEDLLLRDPAQRNLAVERRELELVHRNALRLLKLVNTLLDFSRIEAGRVQAVYEPVDLAAYTAELASTFRSAMERAGLRYRVDCPRLPAPAYVDRDMWEKIVLNLVSNAFKYTLEGEVAVTLRADAAQGAVELTVSDTGIGIPEEEVPRLFERFHRVEGHRGRTQEGTGIGLALVQELAKLHAGTVRVASRPGSGSTFIVRIPLGAAHLPKERIQAVRTQAVTGVRAEAFVEEALRWLPGASVPGEPAIEKDLIGPAVAEQSGAARARVILADDNADMRDYVRRLLAPRYDVEAVADGQEALDAARRERPDLVLSDVMMPRLDGFGLVAALRADAQLNDVPIVLLSARAGDEAKVEGLESGADDYLVKPFAARELIARVATNLELARIRRQATEAIREEARTLETLNRTGAALAGELDLERLVQTVTDAAVELTGAEFGAFFYNVVNEAGEAYTLYTLSGAPREAFAQFPMPRNTAVFDPTFQGEGVVRSDDIRADPRYGRSAPYNGMPPGHLPVTSYLAVPVVSRAGDVLGGLFFGHSAKGVFTERAEQIVVGIAAQAAVAIDNARLYRDLQHLNQTLEQRVAAETDARMKVEEALRQSQKMEAIGQLTGGVAHDFNNLLTVIFGNLETARRRAEIGSGDLQRPLDAALRGAERAATMTQRLLAFSRRQPLAPKPLNLNTLVAGASELLQRTLGEKVAIETTLGTDLWWVSADQNQLENAILNLAVNARDAMPAGGTLRIETGNRRRDGRPETGGGESDAPPGDYVMLAVSDTGTGIPQEIVDKVFEPFFTTKDIGQGTGLGLSQVYGFVKQSGGHVAIASEPGSGTTVSIYLPRLDAGAPGSDGRRQGTAAPAGLADRTILVVEDDDDVRAHTAALLRELGYRIVEAPGGAAALRLLEDEAVDLLFTDLGLPGGMNGRELAEAARRKRPGLKTLFTTGYAREGVADGAPPGEIELVLKPFTFAALAERIRRAIEAPPD